MRGTTLTRTIIWIVLVVILMGLVGWAVVRIVNEYAGTPAGAPPSPGAEQASSTNSNLGETYVNDTYGFSISYPAGFRTGPFAVFHALGNKWRVNASPTTPGTPVVAIPVLRIDNSTSTGKYPLFFDAEVRVGVSDDIAGCYAQDPGYTLQTVADVDIGGTIWKKFIFGDAATMQYLTGASYRTIRNNRCYVVEQIRAGSTYRDNTMTEGYSDEELDGVYAKTTLIVMSLKFTDQ